MSKAHKINQKMVGYPRNFRAYLLDGSVGTIEQLPFQTFRLEHNQGLPHICMLRQNPVLPPPVMTQMEDKIDRMNASDDLWQPIASTSSNFYQTSPFETAAKT